ncbi:MAG TPA: hypothetical protein VE093_44790 [Polyangiaceae bacterium]|nr:hypothetical protein [Polyangiaceae bacterium]
MGKEEAPPEEQPPAPPEEQPPAPPEEQPPAATDAPRGEGGEGGTLAPKDRAPAARSRYLRWVLLLVASLAGLGAAGLLYRSYAAVHLRPIARMPRCVLLATRGLMKPSLVSGSEAYPTPEGEIYLTPAENRAVACLEQRISKPLAQRFARAFTEQEPELRGLELLKTVRDLPPDPSADRDATAAYFIASSAMRALPDLLETKAASEELGQLHACRFSTRANCPTRPPIPIGVWAAGVPSALGFCVAAFVFGRAGFFMARDRLRARRSRRASPPRAQSARPRSPSGG